MASTRTAVIGKTTLEQLNTPLSYRVRQLQLTLERWRWVPHEYSAPPIVVNIPEFAFALSTLPTTARSK
jgi:murein L,D-transpeptidase YcbB/YkuD